MLAAGVDANCAEDGWTPLMAALREPPDFFDDNATAVVSVLLAAGADVNAREPGTGRTPLHEAVRPGKRAVRLLLEYGADPNAVSISGQTPLHECSEYVALEAAEVLLQAGADPQLRDREGRSAGDLAWIEATKFPDDESIALAELLAPSSKP